MVFEIKLRSSFEVKIHQPYQLPSMSRRSTPLQPLPAKSHAKQATSLGHCPRGLEILIIVIPPELMKGEAVVTSISL